MELAGGEEGETGNLRGSRNRKMDSPSLCWSDKWKGSLKYITLCGNGKWKLLGAALAQDIQVSGHFHLRVRDKCQGCSGKWGCLRNGRKKEPEMNFLPDLSPDTCENCDCGVGGEGAISLTLMLCLFCVGPLAAWQPCFRCPGNCNHFYSFEDPISYFQCYWGKMLDKSHSRKEGVVVWI